MKVFVLLLLLFMICSVSAQEGWIDVTPPGHYPALMDVHVSDSQNVWVVGDSGAMLKTTDGGTTWTTASNFIRASLNAVEFLNHDTGWVTGRNQGSTGDSALFRTTDGGTSWQVQPLGYGGQHLIYDMHFVGGSVGEPKRGFITGGLTYTWRTDDHGETWQGIRGSCGEGNFWACSFVDKDTGWFVGYSSRVWPHTIMRTTDGGATYEPQANPTLPEPGQPLRDVCFATSLRGLAVGLVNTILYTSNGGNTWEKRTNFGYRWNSVALRPSGKAWAVGSSGNIAYSTDWGYTWTQQVSGTSAELWRVQFLNDEEGWITGGGVGQPGIILHTTSGGVVTDVDPSTTGVVREFALEQNYPNPFNPATVISFQLPAASDVRLSVCDLLGREVAILLNEQKPPGRYEVQFKAGSLPSGVYVYRLRAGTFVQSRMMLLIR